MTVRLAGTDQASNVLDRVATQTSRRPTLPGRPAAMVNKASRNEPSYRGFRIHRFTKRRRYQEAGVPVYWIVDGDKPCVEVWTPAAELPQVEAERLVWRPVGAERTFTFPLAELFRPV